MPSQKTNSIPNNAIARTTKLAAVVVEAADLGVVDVDADGEAEPEEEAADKVPPWGASLGITRVAEEAAFWN
jgi:hypothetical protein